MPNRIRIIPIPAHSKISYSNATPSGSLFLEPFLRSIDGREQLDVFGVADQFAAIDVDKPS